MLPLSLLMLSYVAMLFDYAVIRIFRCCAFDAAAIVIFRRQLPIALPCHDAIADATVADDGAMLRLPMLLFDAQICCAVTPLRYATAIKIITLRRCCCVMIWRR